MGRLQWGGTSESTLTLRRGGASCFPGDARTARCGWHQSGDELRAIPHRTDDHTAKCLPVVWTNIVLVTVIMAAMIVAMLVVAFVVVVVVIVVVVVVLVFVFVFLANLDQIGEVKRSKRRSLRSRLLWSQQLTHCSFLKSPSSAMKKSSLPPTRRPSVEPTSFPDC
jgi:hypothetical protein